MKLADATLPSLPQNILRPTYHRSALSPGIIHIGLGNFHRAHQSWYLHRLMEEGKAHDWAILGASVRIHDRAQREKLLAQDCLTTLIELEPTQISAEIVGSMIGYIPIEEDNAALIAQMAKPATRIVALTVTEGGYYIDPVTQEFDRAHPDIVHDAQNPNRPKTAFGAMVAALKARQTAGYGPFTGQSCDNLQGNGAILRQTVVGLARLSDPELADWIDRKCSFPNSMVDCIVPATGSQERALAQELGIKDAVPVTHENFRQWVIEDDFCAGRPNWDEVGATFTDHVHDYEIMKIRVLNGGHQLIANIGEILSVGTIHGCMKHQVIGDFFSHVAQQEIALHVKDVPGMSAMAYVDLIHARFSNPKIADKTRRVAFDGSSRHPGFILPSLRAALAKNTPFEGLALAEALWARMCIGTREDGSVIEANDPNWETLQKTAVQAKSNPGAWIEQKSIYGNLGEHDEFAKVFCFWLNAIYARGVTSVVTTYLKKLYK